MLESCVVKWWKNWLLSVKKNNQETTHKTSTKIHLQNHSNAKTNQCSALNCTYIRTHTQMTHINVKVILKQHYSHCLTEFSQTFNQATIDRKCQITPATPVITIINISCYWLCTIKSTSLLVFFIMFDFSETSQLFRTSLTKQTL